MPLLLNEQVTVRVKGQAVQILGIPWGSPDRGRRDAAYEAHVETVAKIEAKQLGRHANRPVKVPDDLEAICAATEAQG